MFWNQGSGFYYRSVIFLLPFFHVSSFQQTSTYLTRHFGHFWPVTLVCQSMLQRVRILQLFCPVSLTYTMCWHRYLRPQTDYRLYFWHWELVNWPFLCQALRLSNMSGGKLACISIQSESQGIIYRATWRSLYLVLLSEAFELQAFQTEVTVLIQHGVLIRSLFAQVNCLNHKMNSSTFPFINSRISACSVFHCQICLEWMWLTVRDSHKGTITLLTPCSQPLVKPRAVSATVIKAPKLMREKG